eukprot:7484799-Alexandrium_andersonii.AAC.1
MVKRWGWTLLLRGFKGLVTWRPCLTSLLPRAELLRPLTCIPMRRSPGRMTSGFRWLGWACGGRGVNEEAFRQRFIFSQLNR